MKTSDVSLYERPRPVAGVLGGMGPYATAAFFKRIIDMTPARRDWDHIRIIIDNNPHIPSRTRHVLFNEPSPFDGMLDSCLRLQSYPTDIIAIPCNSAVIFTERLKDKISIPILNICEVAVMELLRAHPHTKRVLVLGGYVTYSKGTYRPFLDRFGVEMIDYKSEEQSVVIEIIEQLKLKGHLQDISFVQAFLNKLIRKYLVDAVVFGCTELNMLIPIQIEAPVVDSTDALAKSIIAFATNVNAS